MSREFRFYVVDIVKVDTGVHDERTRTAGKEFGPIQASSAEKAAEFALDEFALDDIDKKHFGYGEYKVSVKMDNGFISTLIFGLYPERIVSGRCLS